MCILVKEYKERFYMYLMFMDKNIYGFIILNINI